MKKILAGMFIVVLICSVSIIEAGQPMVYARVETGSTVWTVERGHMWYTSWVLYLRTVNGTVLDAKQIGGGGDNYRSYIRRIQMEKNGDGGVYLLFVATSKWGRVPGSITDNNFNWNTRRIERRIVESWQERP